MRLTGLAALLVAGCYTSSSSTTTTPTPLPQPAPAPQAEVTESTARGAASRLMRGLRRNDRAAVRAMLDTSVRVVDLELESDTCQDHVGRRARTLSGGALDTLAGCLGELTDFPLDAVPRIALRDNAWAAEVEGDCANHRIFFAARADGTVAVRSIVAESTCEGGEEGGVVGGVIGGDPCGYSGGVVGGVAGGVYGAPPPPPPPPPPNSPQNVPPTLLEGNRIAGDKLIVPDDPTKKQIAQSGKDRIIGSFKLCVDVKGNVVTVKMLKSTGFPDYDAKLQREMTVWRYRPYMVNGKAVPVCTAVTFIYSQTAPPSPRPAP